MRENDTDQFFIDVYGHYHTFYSSNQIEIKIAQESQDVSNTE